MASELEGPAEDVGVRVEMTPPELVADHRDWMRLGGCVVAWCQQPTEVRAQPEDFVAVPRYELASRELGLAGAGHAETHARSKGAEAGERIILLQRPELLEGPREGSAVAREFGEEHQLLGHRDRQLSQEDRIDQAEYRRRRTDAERERQHRRRREGRALAKRAQRTPDVLADVLEPRPFPFSTRVLSGARQIAELPRFGHRGDRLQLLLHVPLGRTSPPR